MRVSVNDKPFKRYDVFLDGVKLKRCVEADDDKGEALVCLCDKNGNPFLKRGNHVLHVVRGLVEIEELH